MSINNDNFEDYSEIDSSEGHPEKTKMRCWVKSLIITGGVIFSLAFLAFLLVFVAFPIAFMESLAIERYFMFFNFQNPENPEFGNPGKYNIEGVNNFYVTTEDVDGHGLVKIGAWQVLPSSKIGTTEHDVIKLLNEEKEYPILLYLHGVACNRILPTVGYKVLREKFHIIGIDYRGYGDSTDVPLTEHGIINDNVQVFDFIRNNTSQDIYIWGHSLGSALSIHTVKALKELRNAYPAGLIIESAFSTMREEVENNSIGKFFKWLAYFEQTVLTPLEDHGFRFWSTTNIKSVDVPTMHMHAEDDNVIPWNLGEKLMNVAKNRSGMADYTQWYKFETKLGYSHNNIITDPRIPQYVENFTSLCKTFWTKKDGRKH